MHRKTTWRTRISRFQRRMWASQIAAPSHARPLPETKVPPVLECQCDYCGWGFECSEPLGAIPVQRCPECSRNTRCTEMSRARAASGRGPGASDRSAGADADTVEAQIGWWSAALDRAASRAAHLEVGPDAAPLIAEAARKTAPCESDGRPRQGPRAVRGMASSCA